MEFPSVVFWPWLSAEAFTALSELLSEKQLFMRTASLLTYHSGGEYPALDVATRAQHYQSDRWLPVVLTTNNPAIS